MAGGDTICTNLANARGIYGSWKALLSVAGTNANSRMSMIGPTYNFNDQLIGSTSANWLWTGSITNAIQYSESKVSLSAARVWTGTSWNGNGASTKCSDWTSSSSGVTGLPGYLHVTNYTWANVDGIVKACNLTHHLYCVSQ